MITRDSVGRVVQAFPSRNVVVIMDSSAGIYANVFRKGGSPDGYLRSTARDVARLARIEAPEQTGWLKNSIGTSQNRDEMGRFAFGYAVHARASYAQYVHEGTGPSFRQTYPFRMRFPGTNAYAGQMITTDVVRHPGTPANNFLERALVAMVM